MSKSAESGFTVGVGSVVDSFSDVAAGPRLGLIQARMVAGIEGWGEDAMVGRISNAVMIAGDSVRSVCPNPRIPSCAFRAYYIP